VSHEICPVLTNGISTGHIPFYHRIGDELIIRKNIVCMIRQILYLAYVENILMEDKRMKIALCIDFCGLFTAVAQKINQRT